MKAETLKKAILQYAMQGKLVEQNPEDEPASVLLERIKAEKEQLIKDGKIKKEKPLPPITEDEIPYELPKGWEWVKINDIAFVTKLAGFEYTKYIAENLVSKGVPLFKGKNVQNGKLIYDFENYIPEELSDNLFRSQLNKKCLLTPYVGTIGNIAIFDCDYKCHLGSNVGKIELFNNFKKNIIEEYVLYYLRSSIGLSELKKHKKATAQESISIEAIRDVIIAIPPLAEQERIVRKLDQILPLVEEYGKNEEKLSKLNSTLPDKIKQSILQHAVQGKLVPQNPDDEPASVLLTRIKVEKEQLIKDGKIKKEKPLPPITEDEIPFQIPNSWEWVKLGDLCSINPRNIAEDDLDVGFIPMTRINDGYLGGHTYESKKWKDIKSGFTHFKTGDVVVAKITPCFQNRKSTIISEIPNSTGAGTTELHVIRDNTRLLDMRYVLLIVKTEMFIRNGVKNFTGTAGQQRVGKDYISNYVIPLPPLAEQQRIVTKVEELLSIVESLKV